MKKIKFLLLSMLAVSTAAFIGCKENAPDNGSAIKVVDTSTLTQTLYANQTEGTKAVVFTTTDAWESSATEAGKVIDWAWITPAAGNAAGEYSVKVGVKANDTGADRSAVITITCEEHSVSITVTQKAEKGSEVVLDTENLELTVGESKTLKATLPNGVADKTIVWSSGNESIATVNDKGVVTAIAAGTTKITASDNNGSAPAVCDVTVKEKVIVAVTGVELDNATLSIELYDDTQMLTATVLPNDAANKKVVWSSDKPEIVTVDGGKLVAVSVGTAVITVTTEDGGKTASCTVTVTPLANTGGGDLVYSLAGNEPLVMSHIIAYKSGEVVISNGTNRFVIPAGMLDVSADTGVILNDYYFDPKSNGDYYIKGEWTASNPTTIFYVMSGSIDVGRNFGGLNITFELTANDGETEGTISGRYSGTVKYLNMDFRH